MTVLGPMGHCVAEDIRKHGRALLKIVSPNDVNATGGHQSGFYIPKDVASWFTPHYPPPRGVNKKWPVTVNWQATHITESSLAYYGVSTRNEYRLISFGNDFPFCGEDTVDNLLVLIPTSENSISAWFLDLDDDIAALPCEFDVELLDTTWTKVTVVQSVQ
jgi:type II restriction enzyme